MAFVVLQGLPSGFDVVFTFAVAVAGLLLLGVILSLGVYAYQSTRGDGVPDPREVESDDDEVRQGDADDEWDYY